MSYKLTWEPRGVYWEYSGEVTGQEIIEASTAIYGDPRFDSLKYKLVNFMAADNVLINENEVNLIAFQHVAAANSNPYVKTAIVNHEINDLIRLFIANLRESNWQVEAFTNLEEANNWLGRKIAE